MEALEFLARQTFTAANLAREGGIGHDSATEHDVARLRVSCEQRIVVVQREDVPVIGHGERRALERLAVKLLARGAIVEILLHAGMHDELGDSAAAE